MCSHSREQLAVLKLGLHKPYDPAPEYTPQRSSHSGLENTRAMMSISVWQYYDWKQSSHLLQGGMDTQCTHLAGGSVQVSGRCLVMI